MLNRKLIQKGLGSTILLVSIALIATAGTFYGEAKTVAINDTVNQVPRFDTTLLQLSGVSSEDLQDAPVVPLNKQGNKFVHTYLVKNDEHLQLMKKRSPQFFPVMDSIFEAYELPQQLKYLAVVESELRTKIVSHVGAKGTWQFMPTTARLLKLKVSKHYDERTHLTKSTVAAAKYLRDLHKQFGDWLLVIAAYNSGPAPVLKAIKRSGSRNFWKLQHFLPAETRGHVKRFVATHYYFEGTGSVTTMTKAECISYKKAMISYVAKLTKEAEAREESKVTLAIGTPEIITDDKMAKVPANK